MTSVFYDLKEINMTKEEILINALNNRCKYESSKEMDYDTHLAIMDAMDEYAQQQVKNCVIPAVSNSFCCICKNQLTYFEIEKNICTNCGNSPCPTTK